MNCNPTDPAFTTSEIIEFNSGPALGTIGGLTKREYFAGLAMQSVMKKIKKQEGWMKIGAIHSVQMADALIAALNKEPSK